MYVREVFFTMSLHDIYHQKLRAIRHIDRSTFMFCALLKIIPGSLGQRHEGGLEVDVFFAE